MRITAHFTGRLGAYAATTALVLSGAVLTTPSAGAVAHDPVGVSTGSDWLAHQTVNGFLQSGYEDNFTDPAHPTWVVYNDQGLTIDAVESLVEAGRQPGAVTEMTDAVESDAATYSSFGPGQSAKLLVLADTTGRDLATFGGIDLKSDVESHVSTAAASQGRLDGAFGSVLSQTYAARALTATGSGKAADAVSYLLRQQCTAGFFRESYGPGDDDCVDGTSTGSVDATATAVLELDGHVQGAAVTTALIAARQWLASQQQPDGSWLGFGAGNANATGLAARALGDTPASEHAAQWLRAHQAKDGDPAPLAQEKGAVALDDASYDDAKEFGFNERNRPVFVRATAQSVAALRFLPAGSRSLSLTGPTGYRKAGSAAALTVSGTSAGDLLTLTGPGTSTAGTATGPSWTQSVTLPPGTGNRSYVVTDAQGDRAERTLAVLGAKQLSVGTSKYRVKRSRLVTATVSGLAAGEATRVFFKGAVVRSGKANGSGVFKATFRVGRARGVKRIVAVGEFADIRRGTDTIRVVR